MICLFEEALQKIHALRHDISLFDGSVWSQLVDESGKQFRQMRTQLIEGKARLGGETVERVAAEGTGVVEVFDAADVHWIGGERSGGGRSWRGRTDGKC